MATATGDSRYARWVRGFLWSESVHRFFGASIARMPDCGADAEIRPATDADRSAIAVAFPHVPYEQRAAHGDLCWLAYVGGRLAHQTWTSTTRAFIPQVEYERRLAPDEVYFYDCVTAPDLRGRGLYPAAVVFAARRHLPLGRTRAVLGVLLDNAPSLRGVEKAGFSPEFDHVFRTCLGLSWQKEVRLDRRAT
jgi:GNAT superfamily N-acetyltransferase